MEQNAIMHSSCCKIFHVVIAYDLRDLHYTREKKKKKKKLVYNYKEIYVNCSCTIF